MTLIHIKAGYSPVYDSNAFELALFGFWFVMRWYGPLARKWMGEKLSFKMHVGSDWAQRALWKWERL